MLFDALANTDKDTLIEVIKWLIINKNDNKLTMNKIWIGDSNNKPFENDIVNEWAVGITQPGQRRLWDYCLK